jgi:hypothetical protein
MSSNSMPNFERVLKPEGKQFMKACKLYVVSSVSEEGGLGSMRRNSVSMFSPSKRNIVSSSPSRRCNGISSPVTLFFNIFPFSTKWYTVGNRAGKYVDTSHEYNSRTASTATGLQTSTSWRCVATKFLRMEQREAKVLSMATREERVLDSRAMVMW